jgi:hypothetical protein
MLNVFKFLYPSVHVIQMNLFSIFHCGAGRMDCIFRGTVLFFFNLCLLGLEIVMTFLLR